MNENTLDLNKLYLIKDDEREDCGVIQLTKEQVNFFNWLVDNDYIYGEAVYLTKLTSLKSFGIGNGNLDY